VSAKLTWRALDEAAEARTPGNRPAFLPQTLDFSEQAFCWRRNLLQAAIEFLGIGDEKREIPVIVVGSTID
jgi:hypothetical protein